MLATAKPTTLPEQGGSRQNADNPRAIPAQTASRYAATSDTELTRAGLIAGLWRLPHRLMGAVRRVLASGQISAAMHGTLRRQHRAVGFEGLLDEVVGTPFDGGDCRLDIAVTGRSSRLAVRGAAA
jgi:hypothetical protein